MAYEKQNFKDGDILYAAQMNHIEDGIGEIETHRTFKTYSDISQLGITSYAFADVLAAMPDCTIIESEVNPFVSSNGLSFHYGHIRITRVNEWRMTIEVMGVDLDYWLWTGNMNDLASIKLVCKTEEINSKIEIEYLEPTSYGNIVKSGSIAITRFGNVAVANFTIVLNGGTYSNSDVIAVFPKYPKYIARCIANIGSAYYNIQLNNGNLKFNNASTTVNDGQYLLGQLVFIIQ